MEQPVQSLLAIEGIAPSSMKAQWSWALFQWARDFGGSVIIVFIFAPYFTDKVVGDPVAGQVLWGHLNAIAGICTGILGPLLGAVADSTGRRKPWLSLCVGLMVITSALLWWSMPGGAGLGILASAILLVLYTIAYNLSDVFQSSMLPSVAPMERLGFLSGLGIALAQASTLVGLSIVLFAFMLPGNVDWSFLPAHALFGIDVARYENSRIVGPFSALWLVVFSIPLFVFVREKHRTTENVRSALRSAATEVWSTILALKQYRNIARYLISRVFFNDGQVSIMIFSSIYAAGVFKWDALTLTAYALILSLISVPGALIGGLLSDRLGAKQTTILGVSAATVGLIVAISITPDSMFFFVHFDHVPPTHLPVFRTLPELVYMLVAATTSTFVIAVFGVSRTMMARLAPLNKMSQFFGLYALSGTITAFFGPELVATTTALFHSQRAGMASLVVLLALGLLGMRRVREERSIDPAAI